MCLTTICLGYGYGFHLYCFSMIPIMFITEYLAFKLQRRSIKALPVSITIAIIYIISTGYVACFGPIYKRNQIISAFFWIINAIIVFSFLIYYTYYLINIIVLSEKKLQKAAFIDQLTQMFNRHYMYDKLVEITSDNKSCVIAITDIDNFKVINDTYGHNAGDEVLKRISDYIREECKDYEISRWGGEEFLIISYKSIEETIQSFERLRIRIATSPVHYNDKDINVTITIGLSVRKAGQNLDDLYRTNRQQTIVW